MNNNMFAPDDPLRYSLGAQEMRNLITELRENPLPPVAIDPRYLLPGDLQHNVDKKVYNLAPGARLINPIITPVLNRVPRYTVEENYNFPYVKTMFATGPKQRGYFPLRWAELPVRINSLRNAVSFEAQYHARGHLDVVALATANLLRAFMIAEEDCLLYGGNPEDDTYMYADDPYKPNVIIHRLSRFNPYCSPPVQPNLQAYNGIFATLETHWSGAMVRTPDPDLTLLQNIEDLLDDMTERNGIRPDTIYMNSYEAHYLFTERQKLEGSIEEIAKNFSRATLKNGTQVRVHPTIPQGNVLVVTSKLPDDLIEFLDDEKIDESAFPRVPWSFGLFYDYRQLQYIDSPLLALGLEVRTCGTFRLHAPYLFGWLRDIPKDPANA